MNDQESKQQLLKAKVVALVKDFVNAEGGITQQDLYYLFGMAGGDTIYAALAQSPISFSP